MKESPQGVFEEARVTATCQEQWLDLPRTAAQHIEFIATILFPWDPEEQLFTGEQVFFYVRNKY